MKGMITLFAAAVFAFASCGGGEGGSATDNSVTMTLSSEDFSFGYAAESREYTVTCGNEWGVSVDGGVSWATVSPSGGLSGSTVIKVSVSENKTYEERSAKLVFKSGSFRKEYVLVQGFNASTDIAVPEGYRLVWNDEFDEGDTPDTEKWWYETGGGGWGNNEIQTYVAGKIPGGAELATIKNGVLTISCMKSGDNVYSIRMNTIEGWTYGWFEARLRLPSGKGTWPAFWMMPKNFTAWPDDGEIDIMEEVGYHPNYVSSSIHTKSYNHSIGTQKTREKEIKGAQDEFHVYALEWTAQQIRTYVDGEPLFTFANEGKGKDTWPFNAPFYLKLNLAWGGNWGGAQGIDESCLPARYEIDYVRVFQKK